MTEFQFEQPDIPEANVAGKTFSDAERMLHVMFVIVMYDDVSSDSFKEAIAEVNRMITPV